MATIQLIDNDVDSTTEPATAELQPQNQELRNDNDPQQLHSIIAQYDSSAILQSIIPSSDKFQRIVLRIIKTSSELPNDTSYDLIIENERGGIWFGIQLFSASLLIPKYDPAHLTTITNEPIQNMRLFPLKNESEWKWYWNQWYVLMLEDTDDKGWLYSTRFSSKHWRGCFRFFGFTFVRRRVWIRLRQRVNRW